jgi:hypothetical protein
MSGLNIWSARRMVFPFLFERIREPKSKEFLGEEVTMIGIIL